MARSKAIECIIDHIDLKKSTIVESEKGQCVDSFLVENL